MGYISNRQLTSTSLSSTSSVYLKAHSSSGDRDSGFTEAESDLDSKYLHISPQSPLTSTTTTAGAPTVTATTPRGIYPFSDDDEDPVHHHHSWSATFSNKSLSSNNNNNSSNIKLKNNISPYYQPLIASSTSTSFHSTTLLNESSYHIYQADKAISSIQQLYTQNGWKKALKHKSGVVVYMLQKQTNNEKLAVFKGETTIHGFSPQSIFHVIGMRRLWDDM